MPEPLNTIKGIRYIKSFDTIRALAALSVVLFHSGLGISFRGGWLAVELFFILSGYLITSVLQNEYSKRGKINIPRFYLNRVLRILPPLLLCLIFANLLWPFSKIQPESKQALSTLASLFSFINVIKVNTNGNLAHLWSLSVEEQFYLCWPLLLPLILALTKRKKISIFVIAIIAISVIRIINWRLRNVLHFGLISIDAYRFILSRADCILYGALLAVIINNRNIAVPINREDRRPGIILFALFSGVLILFLFLNMGTSIWYYGGFLITNTYLTAVVYMSIVYQDHLIFKSKLLNWLGKRSYGIYLFHLPVIQFLDKYRQHRSILSFIAYTGITLCISISLAALSYRFVEEPIAAYRARLKDKQPGLATAA